MIDLQGQQLDEVKGVKFLLIGTRDTEFDPFLKALGSNPFIGIASMLNV
jgi:hypothetical protein